MSGTGRGARSGVTRRGPPRVGLVAVGVALACAPLALDGPDCRPTRTGIALPPELVESSGIAVGRRDSTVLWTHNDDGSVLYAIDGEGTVLGRWGVRPEVLDWEDLAVADCEAHGTCLYLADTGDNAEQRRPGTIRILRIAEPDVGAGRTPGATVEGEVFPLRLPDGPRDVEALYVLPGERLHLITKGRNHPVTVYRYPTPLRPDTVTLVEVQRLTRAAAPIADQVTGASASTDGRTVAVRTYQSLEFFRVLGDTLGRVQDGLVNLRTLREAQGEAVALGPGGLVVLTSEGGVFGAAAAMNVMRCRVEARP